MSSNLSLKDTSSKDTDQLLAEAEELIQRINSDALNEMKEEHRLQVEIHAQNLKKIKAEVKDRIEKRKTSKMESGADGIHEAILEIKKAMQGLTKYIS